MSTSRRQPEPSETRSLVQYVDVSRKRRAEKQDVEYERDRSAERVKIPTLAPIIDYCLTILKNDAAVIKAFEDLPGAENRWHVVQEYIDNHPPEFALYDLTGRKKQSMAICHRGVGKNGAIIFIDLRLVNAIEKSPADYGFEVPDGVDVQTNLCFLSMVTLMHELRHWVQGVLQGMDTMSDENQQYKQHGKEKNTKGESGCMGERRLWGGIVVSGLAPGATTAKAFSSTRSSTLKMSFAPVELMPWERVFYLARTRARSGAELYKNLEIFFPWFVHDTVERAREMLLFIPARDDVVKDVAKKITYDLDELQTALAPRSEESADQGPSGSATRTPGEGEAQLPKETAGRATEDVAQNPKKRPAEGRASDEFPKQRGAKLPRATEPGQASEDAPQIPSQGGAALPKESQGQASDVVPQTPKRVPVVKAPGKGSPDVHLPHPSDPSKAYPPKQRVSFTAAKDDEITWTPIETDSDGVRKRSYAPLNSKYMEMEKMTVELANMTIGSSDAELAAAAEQGPVVIFIGSVETVEEPATI